MSSPYPNQPPQAPPQPQQPPQFQQGYPPAQQPYGAPQYGSPQYGAPQYGAPARTNVLAIFSLISAFFISILAVVLGHVALSQIKRTGEGGRGLAIAGLIIGYFGVCVWICFIALFLFIGIAELGRGTFMQPFWDLMDAFSGTVR